MRGPQRVSLRGHVGSFQSSCPYGCSWNFLLSSTPEAHTVSSTNICQRWGSYNGTILGYSGSVLPGVSAMNIALSFRRKQEYMLSSLNQKSSTKGGKGDIHLFIYSPEPEKDLYRSWAEKRWALHKCIFMCYAHLSFTKIIKTIFLCKAWLNFGHQWIVSKDHWSMSALYFYSPPSLLFTCCYVYVFIAALDVSVLFWNYYRTFLSSFCSRGARNAFKMEKRLLNMYKRTSLRKCLSCFLSHEYNSIYSCRIPQFQ